MNLMLWYRDGGGDKDETVGIKEGKVSDEGLEPTPHHETSLFNLFRDSVGRDDIDEGEMKRVENVDVAEIVEAMGVVSNMIDEGNDAAFDVPCNEIAAGSILARSGSENNATEFGGDVVKNDGEDVNLNVQNNENNVNVGGRTENANIPGVRFEKHDDGSDCTDWIDSNHRKEINECKSLVIESELTTSRSNEAYVNNDENKKAIPNRKSAGDMGDDPKDSINGDKALDGRAGNISIGMGNIKGMRDEQNEI